MIVLRNFIKKPYNLENINKYKSKDNLLRHARYDRGLTQGIILVDRKSDNLVGYIAWENNYIIALEVTRNYQNKGIATKLLNEAVENGVYKLSVNKNNTGALKLYKNLGWKIVKEDQRMYYMEYSSRTKYYSIRERVPSSIAKEGRKSGVIQKDPNGKWRIISYKTNPPEFWNAHYETREDAERALSAYHSNKR